MAPRQSGIRRPGSGGTRIPEAVQQRRSCGPSTAFANFVLERCIEAVGDE